MPYLNHAKALLLVEQDGRLIRWDTDSLATMNEEVESDGYSYDNSLTLSAGAWTRTLIDLPCLKKRGADLKVGDVLQHDGKITAIGSRMSRDFAVSFEKIPPKILRTTEYYELAEADREIVLEDSRLYGARRRRKLLVERSIGADDEVYLKLRDDVDRSYLSIYVKTAELLAALWRA